MGIWRLLVALKYQFYKNIWGGGAVQSSRAGAKKFRIPWFKVGLVGVAIFFFTQKDIQFSINMKAPLGGEEYGASQTSQGGDHQQMNVAQAISFREKGKKNKKTEAALNLNEQRVDEYISRFRKVALMEMKKFGIPASVKMAWGLLESEAGQKPESKKPFWKKMGFGEGALEEGAEVDAPTHMQEDRSVPEQGQTPDSFSHPRGK